MWKSHLHTSQTIVTKKKSIEILQLTLLCHNKFLKKRENKQLRQMQIIGPDGMDSHHQWCTTDRITSSQQQISHGMVLQGYKLNTCIHVTSYSANKKIFFREIMTYEGGTHLLMKLHTWVKDLQLSSSFL